MWQPSYPGEPVPETLYVLVNSAAWARSGAGQLSLQASNSLGDNDEGSSSIMNVKRGLRLVQVATGGSTRVEVGEVQLSAQGSGTASPSMPLVRGLADVYYEAQVDTRGVIITSPTIEDSWYQGFRFGHPLQEPNVRKPDGSIVTDSAASWMNGGFFLFAGTLEAVTAGFTGLGHNDYKWNNSGPGQLSPVYDNSSPFQNLIPNQQRLQIEFGSNPSSVKGKSSEIKVSITDPADGAKAENTFKINWHLEYENWKPYADPYTVWHGVNLEVDNPGYASNNSGGVPCTWQDHSYWWGPVQTAVTGLEDVLPIPYAAELFGLAGAGLEQFAPKEYRENASFDECWRDRDISTFDVPPLRADGTWADGSRGSEDNRIQDWYRMYPAREESYEVRFLEADHYGVNGYIGQHRQVTAVKSGGGRFLGHFVRQGTTSSAGGG